MSRFFVIIFFIILSSCHQEITGNNDTTSSIKVHSDEIRVANDSVSDFQKQLSAKALDIIDPSIIYTATYVSIAYPNGDVPANTGVCADVVIRAYRKLDIDLQKEVHEDMKKNFNLYPKKWGLKRTDRSIDHRRVPNLEVYFSRFGKKLPITQNPEDYKTGEIVTWMINDSLPHIGIVTDQLSADGKRRLIVHNIGRGQVLEDILFDYPITGHYVYIK